MMYQFIAGGPPIRQDGNIPHKLYAVPNKQTKPLNLSAGSEYADNQNRLNDSAMENVIQREDYPLKMFKMSYLHVDFPADSVLSIFQPAVLVQIH